MHVEVNQEELLDLISKTQNIVEKRTTMPILSHILLEAKNGYLKVYVTDLEISLTNKIKVDVIEEGKVIIDSKKFYQIIKEFQNDTITLVKNNQQLQISYLKICINIMSLKIEEYPTFPLTQFNNPLYIQSTVLKEMIEKTIYSISHNESRYHLNGVYFEQFKDKSKLFYKMVSTDGHRLSVITRLVNKKDNTSNNDIKSGVIIPHKGLNEMKRLLDRDSEKVEVYIEGVQLIVKQRDTFLLIRLIEGVFPEYELFIPKKSEKKFQVSKDKLISSLKLASILTSEKSRSVKFFLSQNQLEITSENPDLGDIKEELEVSYDNKNEIIIEFNVQYLLDFLNSFEEETVYIGLNDSEEGGVFRPLNDKDYMCVIMPMKI